MRFLQRSQNNILTTSPSPSTFPANITGHFTYFYTSDAREKNILRLPFPATRHLRRALAVLGLCFAKRGPWASMFTWPLASQIGEMVRNGGIVFSPKKKSIGIDRMCVLLDFLR